MFEFVFYGVCACQRTRERWHVWICFVYMFEIISLWNVFSIHISTLTLYSGFIWLPECLYQSPWAHAGIKFWKAPSVVALLSPSTRALAYLRMSVCTSRHELTQAHVHACVCVYICLPRLYVCPVCTRVCVCTYVYHAYMYALYVCARVCVYICIPRLYVCLICMPYMYARVCVYMYTTPQRFHPLT